MDLALVWSHQQYCNKDCCKFKVQCNMKQEKDLFN